MFGWITGGLKVLGGALDVTKWFQKRSDRNRDRDAGRNEQRLEQQDKTNEARERMDAVKPASDAATRKRLRDKTF